MAKTALVLVPGLLCDEELYAHQVSFLSDLADVMVADTFSDDSMEGMADRLLAAAPERFALAGLSMGGYVAQEVMRRAPGRVQRLALLDTNARADLEEQKANRMAQVKRARDGDFAGVVDDLIPNLVHEDRVRDEDFMDRVRQMNLRAGVDVLERQQTAIMNRPDGREDLRKIDVPTLCLCGYEDALTPPKVHREMVDLLPHGSLVTIEDCGHLSTMERPRAVTAVLRYWLQCP